MRILMLFLMLALAAGCSIPSQLTPSLSPEEDPIDTVFYVVERVVHDTIIEPWPVEWTDSVPCPPSDSGIVIVHQVTPPTVKFRVVERIEHDTIYPDATIIQALKDQLKLEQDKVKSKTNALETLEAQLKTLRANSKSAVWTIILSALIFALGLLRGKKKTDGETPPPSPAA